MSTCSWYSSGMPSQQCRWPGVFSGSMHGDHKWRCVWHFRIAEEGPSERNFHGNRIVAESIAWDGSQASYLEARFRDRLKGKGAAKPAGMEAEAKAANGIHGRGISRMADVLPPLEEVVSSFREPGQDEQEAA